ncbi:MAG TPA: HD domain-containing phosphohydrolase [Solirubrobacteraceae bacterium]
MVYSASTVGALACLSLVDHRSHSGLAWISSFVALVLISAVADSSRLRRPGWIGSFDASFVVGLTGLVLVGPIGAAAAIVLPDVIGRAVRRHRFWHVATLSTVSGLSWGAVAGAIVLQAAPGSLTALSAVPALLTAGLAWAAVSYVTGPGLFAVVRERRSLAASARPFTETLGLQLLVVLCGVAVTLATGPLGIWALLGFVVAIRLPGLALGELTKLTDAGTVGPDQARRVYAQAMADVLALPRSERRLLDQGLDIMAGRTPERLSAPVVELTEAILHRDERWDGDGDPAGLSGAWIPRVARILAVADAWSAVTAQGTARLPHDEALLGLATGAGTRFDPDVVDAATAVVAAEAPYATQESFLPRLHRAPLPRTVRRNTLPRVLGAVAAE